MPVCDYTVVVRVILSVRRLNAQHVSATARQLTAGTIFVVHEKRFPLHAFLFAVDHTVAASGSIKERRVLGAPY